MTGRAWDASYQAGPAPWDVGGPHPAIVRLGAAGGFTGADAFVLPRLGRTFGTVLDCGMVHTCDAGERLRSVAGVASVLKPGGGVPRAVLQ